MPTRGHHPRHQPGRHHRRLRSRGEQQPGAHRAPTSWPERPRSLVDTRFGSDVRGQDHGQRRRHRPGAARRRRRRPLASSRWPATRAEVGQPVVAVALDEGQRPVQRDRHHLPAQPARDHLDRLGRSPGCWAPSSTRPPETSGGGLFNTNGELVGILTSPPGVSTTGLAVPIRIADDVRDQIESSGKVDPRLARPRRRRRHATVPAPRSPPSFPDSPAAAAKLEVGDVITRAGGQFVGGLDDLIAEWRRTVRATRSPSTTAGAAPTVRLRRRPRSPARRPAPPRPRPHAEPAAGLVDELNCQACSGRATMKA